jgi:hypothetical protein
VFSVALSLSQLNEKTLADKETAKVPSIQLIVALCLGRKERAG